jgi:hypothetical protein
MDWIEDAQLLGTLEAVLSARYHWTDWRRPYRPGLSGILHELQVRTAHHRQLVRISQRCPQLRKRSENHVLTSCE